ncbi:unnamed protein product [Rotaria magnacalcarata]
MFLFVIEEEIDGPTLVLLQHDDIVQIFPRIKDRVKFIDQRAKLTSNLTDQCQNILSENDTSTSTSASSLSNDNLELNSDNNQITDSDTSNHNCSDDNDDIMTIRLPVDYEGPDLTMKMQQHIDDNNLSKFFPHTAMRSELLSLFFNDITESYKLYYPTNDEYRTMAKCIVKKLRIPSSLANQAIKDWHESIKQKFKRERKPLQMTNNYIKLKQDQYGNGKTNGRPKKKSIVLQAERRVNDVPMINLSNKENENLLPIVNQMKMELLKDDPDNDLIHDLWRQSFNIRRLCIHELSIAETLDRFPGYRRSDMILAEVKESVGVDLYENINELLPKFFDQLPDNTCFPSDVLPIRTIRILCKLFGDTIHNVFTHEDILVPYPCIKILDDKFELYLDFNLVTETNSCTHALALLLSIYHVFEIRFHHHIRCIRLLYGVLFEDVHYLNKGLRTLLNGWNYKIINRASMARKTIINNLVFSLTQPTTTNETISTSSYRSNQIPDPLLKEHVENESSISDDEDEANRLSINSTPALSPQIISSTILQNKTQSQSATENNPSTYNSTKSNQSISHGNLLSTKIGTEERDQAESNENTSSTLKLKHERSSSISLMNVQLQYHCSMIIVNINGKFILSNETITNLFIILDERSSSISMMNVQLQYHCSMIIVNIIGNSMIIVNINDERPTSISLFNDHYERSSSISMVNERPTSISLIDIPRWHISQLRNLAKWMFSSERQIYGIGAH